MAGPAEALLKFLQFIKTTGNQQPGQARCQTHQDNTCGSVAHQPGACKGQDRKAKQQNQVTKKEDLSPGGSKEGWGPEQRRTEGDTGETEWEACAKQWSVSWLTQQPAHGQGSTQQHILPPNSTLLPALPDTCEVAQKCAPA